MSGPWLHARSPIGLRPQTTDRFPVDISKDEQRVLHALAQGGRLTVKKTSSGRVINVEGFTREGWRMPAIAARLFRKLKSKKAVASKSGGPYRITRRGLELVRAQPDNR